MKLHQYMTFAGGVVSRLRQHLPAESPYQFADARNVSLNSGGAASKRKGWEILRGAPAEPLDTSADHPVLLYAGPVKPKRSKGKEHYIVARLLYRHDTAFGEKLEIDVYTDRVYITTFDIYPPIQPDETITYDQRITDYDCRAVCVDVVYQEVGYNEIASALIIDGYYNAGSPMSRGKIAYTFVENDSGYLWYASQVDIHISEYYGTAYGIGTGVYPEDIRYATYIGNRLLLVANERPGWVFGSAQRVADTESGSPDIHPFQNFCYVVDQSGQITPDAPYAYPVRPGEKINWIVDAGDWFIGTDHGVYKSETPIQADMTWRRVSSIPTCHYDGVVLDDKVYYIDAQRENLHVVKWSDKKRDHISVAAMNIKDKYDPGTLRNLVSFSQPHLGLFFEGEKDGTRYTFEVRQYSREQDSITIHNSMPLHENYETLVDGSASGTDADGFYQYVYKNHPLRNIPHPAGFSAVRVYELAADEPNYPRHLITQVGLFTSTSAEGQSVDDPVSYEHVDRLLDFGSHEALIPDSSSITKIEAHNPHVQLKIQNAGSGTHIATMEMISDKGHIYLSDYKEAMLAGKDLWFFWNFGLDTQYKLAGDTEDFYEKLYPLAVRITSDDIVWGDGNGYTPAGEFAGFVKTFNLQWNADDPAINYGPHHMYCGIGYESMIELVPPAESNVFETKYYNSAINMWRSGHFYVQNKTDQLVVVETPVDEDGKPTLFTGVRRESTPSDSLHQPEISIHSDNPSPLTILGIGVTYE